MGFRSLNRYRLFRVKGYSRHRGVGIYGIGAVQYQTYPSHGPLFSFFFTKDATRAPWLRETGSYRAEVARTLEYDVAFTQTFRNFLGSYVPIVSILEPKKGIQHPPRLKTSGPHQWPWLSVEDLPIVSVVVPFWGYLLGSFIWNWLNPKKRNYNGHHR